jgi:transposase-like protein
MSAMIICPYCGEYTLLSGVDFLDAEGVCSGRDKCRICGKMFLYEYTTTATTRKIQEE